MFWTEDIPHPGVQGTPTKLTGAPNRQAALKGLETVAQSYETMWGKAGGGDAVPLIKTILSQVVKLEPKELKLGE